MTAAANDRERPAATGGAGGLISPEPETDLDVAQKHGETARQGTEVASSPMMERMKARNEILQRITDALTPPTMKRG